MADAWPSRLIHVLMKIDIISIFPDYFDSPLSVSLLAKAAQAGIFQVKAHDLRDFTADKHRQVDDTPYGGGPGMIMKPEPFYAALTELLPGASSSTDLDPSTRVIMLSPHGRPLRQHLSRELASAKHLVLLCGRYEGIDARVEENWCTDVVSVGDYVLMGGEAAALVVIESVVRLLPGVLGSDESAVDESFSSGLLEYPQYTKPEHFAGLSVPQVLLSGDHGKVAEWRREQSENRTAAIRPDLLGK